MHVVQMYRQNKNVFTIHMMFDMGCTVNSGVAKGGVLWAAV